MMFDCKIVPDTSEPITDWQQKKTTKKIKPKKPTKDRKKYKGIWREMQLAVPKLPRKKYEPPYNGPLKLIQKSLPIGTDIIERCSQLAFPFIRTIRMTRQTFKHLFDKEKMAALTNFEKRALQTVYLMYKRNQIQHDKWKRQQAQEEILELRSSPKTVKEAEERIERIKKLAKPKPIHKPEILPFQKRKTRPLDQIDFEMLAIPVKRKDLPPKSLEINPAALTYTATENVIKLSRMPIRWTKIPPPQESGRPVSKAALKYKMTPGVERLYVIKERKEGALVVANDVDVWKVSPQALTYKTTARILELAKPIERK